MDLGILFSCLPPVPVDLLPDLPAHGGLQARQVVPRLLLAAVRDGEGGVVEGIRALGITVRPTGPTFDTGR